MVKPYQNSSPTWRRVDLATDFHLVADQYPSASVVGTDLSPIQPKWVPVNVRMYVDDCEEPDWPHGSNFDLVHFRGMAGTLRDLDRMLKRTYPYVFDETDT
jgi:hypothetical protein